MARIQRNIRWRVASTVCVAMLLASPVWAQGRSPRERMDSAVATAARGERHQQVGVIVTVSPDKRHAVETALAKRKVTPSRRFAGGHGLGVSLTADDLAALAAMDGVIGISSDAVISAAGGGARKKKAPTSTTPQTTVSQPTPPAPALTSTTPTVEATARLSAFLSDLGASGQQWATLRGSLGIQWSAAAGAGVGVAVVDSGIDGTAPEFEGRISAFYDFTQGGALATPTDDYGHGTHVAALIGAQSLLFAGIAPRVHFVGAKVLDSNGKGRTSDLIAALEFLTANRRALKIHVINLSLGHPILEPAATDPLVQAVERAVAAGLVVVTSAGNHGQNPTTGVAGYAGITSPGNAPSAITVGSLDMNGTADRRDDTVSPFSSRGPTWYDSLVKPDILAPGHGLFGVSAAASTLATDDTAKLSASGAEVKLFGTSMAAATATGVVALALEANRLAFPNAGRDLPPGALKAILQYSSVALVDPATGLELDLLTQGAGGVNAAGAMALARALDPGTRVGSVWLATAVTERSTFGGVELPWTRRIVWGATPLFGDAIYANAPAWQSNIVWGSTLVWGEALIWGDTLVWGENVVTSDALIWGESIVWGDGLVTVDGQTLVWGDALIWGEALVWGDAVVLGSSVPQ